MILLCSHKPSVEAERVNREPSHLLGAAGENPGGESPMRVPMQYSEEVFPIRLLCDQRSHQDPGEQGQIRIMNGKNFGRGLSRQ